MRNKDHRRITHIAGQRAEWVAMVFLMLKFYRPIERRYKCPAGEIDLIMARGNLVVFTEVKFRANRDTAAYSVTARQQSRIIRAAGYWIQKHPQDSCKTLRFDVVLLAPWRWPEHIKHAFVDNTGQ